MTDTITVPESARRNRRYGWRPSLGRLELPTANLGGIEIAAEVDNRDTLADWVFNQWALGSCTANATSNHFRFDAVKNGQADPGPLCRLGVYWGERKIEGTIGQGDTGAEGHDAYTVAQHGIPAETAWKYQWEGMEQDQPCPDHYFDPKAEPATYLKSKVAYKLTRQVAAVPQTEDAMKACLSAGQIFSYGFTVYESFESQKVASTGVVPMPKRGEQVLGGHEVLGGGYLEAHPDYCLCLNSWDTSWGMDGFFLMPWRYLTNKHVVSDLRTIVKPAA